MSGTIRDSLRAVSPNSAAPAARADSAIADYSHHVAEELAIITSHTNRDDPNLAGHRPTELTPTEAAA